MHDIQAYQRLHAVVRGRVQGVFFRINTQKKAQELGLNGWIANQPDGTVECIAEGRKENLDALVNWWRNHPGHSRTEAIDLEWSEASDEFREFYIRDS